MSYYPACGELVGALSFGVQKLTDGEDDEGRGSGGSRLSKNFFLIVLLHLGI